MATEISIQHFHHCVETRTNPPRHTITKHMWSMCRQIDFTVSRHKPINRVINASLTISPFRLPFHPPPPFPLVLGYSFRSILLLPFHNNFDCCRLCIWFHATSIISNDFVASVRDEDERTSEAKIKSIFRSLDFC